MFGRLKKKKAPVKKAAPAKGKKMETPKGKKQATPHFQKILTAEGWRRMMMKNKPKKK